MRTSN